MRGLTVSGPLLAARVDVVVSVKAQHYAGSCVRESVEPVLLADLRGALVGLISHLVRRALSLEARVLALGATEEFQPLVLGSSAKLSRLGFVSPSWMASGAPAPGQVLPNSVPHLFVSGSRLHVLGGAQLGRLRQVG